MPWYIARWGKIKQVEVVKETTYRVLIVFGKGWDGKSSKPRWINKQTSESLVTQQFSAARRFLMDLHKSNVERLQDALSDAQDVLKQVASLTIEDTK